MKLALPMIILAVYILSGCSEENAAKIAPYLGTKTLNEKKADAFAKIALQKANSCEAQDLELEEFTECFEKAVKFVMEADALCKKDCGYGNAAACRKRAELYQKWDSHQAE